MRVTRRCIRTEIIFRQLRDYSIRLKRNSSPSFLFIPEETEENLQPTTAVSLVSTDSVCQTEEEEDEEDDDGGRGETERDALGPSDFENEMIVTEPGDTIDGLRGVLLLVKKCSSLCLWLSKLDEAERRA